MTKSENQICFPQDVAERKKTEFDLQLIVIQDCYHLTNNLVVPNIESGFGEMDVLKVSRVGYATEYEIKVSKNDFNKDKEKLDKHNSYKRAFTFCLPEKGIPNYFIYVVPATLNLTAADVPVYAGLYNVDEHGYLTTVKSPPRIHRQKFREFWIEKIARSLNAKYLHHYFYKLEANR